MVLCCRSHLELEIFRQLQIQRQDLHAQPQERDNSGGQDTAGTGDQPGDSIDANSRDTTHVEPQDSSQDTAHRVATLRTPNSPGQGGLAGWNIRLLDGFFDLRIVG